MPGARGAAARLHGVADAADLQAGRRRRRHRRADSRRRPIEPPVQEAGLREADRAERQRVAAVAACSARCSRSRRPRAPATPPRSSRRRSTRSWPRFAQRAADRAKNGARAQHDRDRHHRRPRAAGRVRRHRRSAEQLQPLPEERRTTSQKDIAAVSRGHAGASVQAFAQASSCTPTARVVVHAVPGTPAPLLAAAAAGGRGRRPRRRAAESINADEPWRNDAAQAGAAQPLQLATPATATLPNGLTLILSERRGRADRRRQPRVPRPAATRTRSTSRGSPTSSRRCSTRARPRATRCRLPTRSRSSARRSAPAARWTRRPCRRGRWRRTSRRRSIWWPTSSLRPSFPADEIERQRAQRLGQLVQQRDNPAALVGTDRDAGALRRAASVRLHARSAPRRR